MYNKITRYDIHLNGEKEQMDLDFILNCSDKKIIHGIVWNDDLTDPKPEENVLVFVYIAGKNYNNDPLDIINISYAVTDKNGEFFIGPFNLESAVILKIYKMNKRNTNIDGEDSFQTNRP